MFGTGTSNLISSASAAGRTEQDGDGDQRSDEEHRRNRGPDGDRSLLPGFAGRRGSAVAERAVGDPFELFQQIAGGLPSGVWILGEALPDDPLQ